jgi:hypothetical protein
LSDIREFLVTNLGEVEDKRFQLSEPERRVLKLPATSHRFVKKSLQKARRLFSGSTFNIAEKQAQPPERNFELLLFSERCLKAQPFFSYSEY